MAPLENDSAGSVASHDVHDAACRARDEDARLRAELCQLRMRIEEVEEERNYHKAKTDELQDTIDKQKPDYVREELVKKSLELAEMSMSMETLKLEIKDFKVSNEKLLEEKKLNQSKLDALSGVVKTLQKKRKPGTAAEEEDDDDDDEEVVLTPVKALEMTIKNMKFQIETLEDERQKLAILCMRQKKKIATVEDESKMKDEKINQLEELFRELNQQRNEETHEVHTLNDTDKEKGRPEMAKALSSPDLFAEERKPIRSNSTPDLFASDKRRRREKSHRRESRRSSNRRSMSERNLKSKKRKNVVRVGDLEGTYTGPLADGLPNGVGTIRFDNGDTYLGEVVDGEMHGKGTLYYSEKNKGISRGYFQNNFFMGTKKEVEGRK